jgi:hypothetical protein
MINNNIDYAAMDGWYTFFLFYTYIFTFILRRYFIIFHNIIIVLFLNEVVHKISTFQKELKILLKLM